MDESETNAENPSQFGPEGDQKMLVDTVTEYRDGWSQDRLIRLRQWMLPALRSWNRPLHFRNGALGMEGTMDEQITRSITRICRRLWVYLFFGGKKAFIRRYCERSHISWEQLKQRRRVIPCDCGESMCEGWAMVPHDYEQPDSNNDVGKSFAEWKRDHRPDPN